MNVHIPHKVFEIMSRDVVSVNEDESLLHLLSSLNAMRFRHLPVTDRDRLIGLVTERDLLGIAGSRLLPNHAEQDRQLQERFRVRDIMIRNVVTVSPDATLSEAGRLLLRERIGCLPVVDDERVLVGMLTSSDFVKLVVEAQR